MITTKIRWTARSARACVRRIRGIWFPEPLPPEVLSDLAARIEAEGQRHCTCSSASSNHQVHMDDHEPGCRWLAVRCRTCVGTGWCHACGGEGLASEDGAELERGAR